MICCFFPQPDYPIQEVSGLADTGGGGGFEDQKITLRAKPKTCLGTFGVPNFSNFEKYTHFAKLDPTPHTLFLAKNSKFRPIFSHFFSFFFTDFSIPPMETKGKTGMPLTTQRICRAMCTYVHSGYT